MSRVVSADCCRVSTVTRYRTLSRLEGLILEVSTNPQRELLGSVIDLIVHMERAGRQFRCTAILAVQGYDTVRMAYNLTEMA